MRERRGKGVEEMYNGGEYFQDYTEALPCRRHPYSSPVGVCSYCLKERLVSLVCSDCGELRLSSCSCSSSSSEIPSSTTTTTTNGGDVGTISFLLENDHGRRNGFWRIGRLFRKKKRSEKGINGERKSSACEETKSTSGSDVWVVDYMGGGGGVSRSRSLCSFRGGGGGTLFGSEDGSTFSGARSSVSNARSSGFNGGLLFDPDRRSGFSEPEPRRSGFDDDPGFIDLKFDHLPTNIIIPEVKLGSLSDSNTAFGSMRSGGDDHLLGDGFVPHGGSCRITVGERRKGIKRSRKSFKSWRWIFSHHVPSFMKKNDEVQVVKEY